MATVTVDDVREVLGELDDVAVAEIQATGASRDEIAEAQAWFDGDDAIVQSQSGPSSSRVARVIAILDDAMVEDEEEIYGPV